MAGIERGYKMVKVKIYEKGMTYHSAITLDVDSEKHRRELEEILIACGNPYMVEPVEKNPFMVEPVEKIKAHGADGETFVVGGDKDDF